MATGARFPAREQIIFITFCVIFITLVVQSLTLAPMARWLRLGVDEIEAGEEAHARLAAAEAGLRALADEAITSGEHQEVVHYLRQRHLQRARRWAAREKDEAAHQTTPPEVAHEHYTVAPSHEAAVIDEQ